MKTLRNQYLIIPCVALTLLSAAERKATGSYIPFNWSLTTGVSDTGGSQTVVDFDHVTQVNSPFDYTSYGSVGPHSAQAQYDFLFHPELNLGTFDTDVALHVSPDNNINSSNSGRFRITPDVDLPIQIDALLDYATPSTPVVLVSFTVRVFDVANQFPLLFNGGGQGGTITLEPAVGTISTSGERVLLAGHTYELFWNASIRTVTDPLPGGPSSASGYVNFSIVPEPSTALMLVLAIPIALRRRR